MKHSWVVRGESWKWGANKWLRVRKRSPLSKEEELKRSLWFERIKKRRTDRDTKRNSCDVFPLFKPRVELLYRTSEIDPWVSPVLSVISFLFLPQALWDQNQSQVLPPPPSTHANMMHCHDSSKCNMIALVMKLYLFVSSSLQLQSCRNLRACKRMPPSDGRLSVPRSRDGTGLQLLWSRLLQPPTRCRLWEVLKIARVDLLNRFNNSAYKLNLLLGFFFFLPLPSFLPSFLRCKCNPIGSSSVACHPITGQCVCRAGVEGRLCDSCRAGFFGFSSRGCRGTGLYFRHRKCSTLWSSHASNTDHTWRHFWLLHVYLCRSPPPPVFSPSHPSLSLCRPPACNCDPMGSISMQCHGNGTCHCRQGFVGYKCDKCELNYFHNRATHQCEECPVCYGLVKKQVSVCLFVTDVCGGSFKILLIEPSNLQLLWTQHRNITSS